MSNIMETRAPTQSLPIIFRLKQRMRPWRNGIFERTATTINVWLSERTKSWLLFWNSNRQFALAANCLDRLARFFKTRCRQTDLESGGELSPARFFAPFRPRNPGNHVAGKGKKRTMDLSKASPRELAIELGKRSAGSGMPPTKTLAALVKAGLDQKTRAKVTKNEKELAALIRRATDSFWQREAAIDWQRVLPGNRQKDLHQGRA
jgi:hypothetical protein